METPLSGITGLDVKGLLRFEPCGQGNRRPVLLSRNVRLVDHRTVGADQSHLRLTVKDGPFTWQGIAFRQADAELADEVDIVYSLNSQFGGERVELEVLDIAPAGTRPLER